MPFSCVLESIRLGTPRLVRHNAWAPVDREVIVTSPATLPSSFLRAQLHVGLNEPKSFSFSKMTEPAQNGDLKIHP